MLKRKTYNLCLADWDHSRQLALQRSEQQVGEILLFGLLFSYFQSNSTSSGSWSFTDITDQVCDQI